MLTLGDDIYALCHEGLDTFKALGDKILYTELQRERSVGLYHYTYDGLYRYELKGGYVLTIGSPDSFYFASLPDMSHYTYLQAELRCPNKVGSFASFDDCELITPALDMYEPCLWSDALDKNDLNAERSLLEKWALSVIQRHRLTLTAFDPFVYRIVRLIDTRLAIHFGRLVTHTWVSLDGFIHVRFLNSNELNRNDANRLIQDINAIVYNLDRDVCFDEANYLSFESLPHKVNLQLNSWYQSKQLLTLNYCYQAP